MGNANCCGDLAKSAATRLNPASEDLGTTKPWPRRGVSVGISCEEEPLPPSVCRDTWRDAELDTSLTRVGNASPAAHTVGDKPGAELWRECHGVEDATSKDKSSTASDSTSASSCPDLSGIQDVVGNVVRSLVQGHDVLVSSTSGAVVKCVLRINRKLSRLTLQRDGSLDSQKRAIALSGVRQVCVGATPEVEGVVTDETSVSLLLESDNALVFCFQDREKREQFAACLAMLVDGWQRTQRPGTPRTC